MMNWLYYLLEANLYLAVFYGFYRLFLHNETFYTLNRYYLIIATLIAFMLPVLQLGYLHNLLDKQQHINTLPSELEKGATGNLSFSVNLIVYCYLIVAAMLLVKLLFSLYKVIRLSVTAKAEKSGKIIYVELPDSNTAFSFFNLLFINPTISEKSTILKHEMVHINQRHSLDIIFFEIIQILCWFNPVIGLVKRDIKLLHEYIADDLTTAKDVQKHDYAMFLIQNSFGIVPNPLTNQIFNQSILKRRINMLNKKRSAGRARLKLLFAIPIASGMLCASTMAFTKDYAIIDLYPEKYESVKALNQDTTRKKTTSTDGKSKDGKQIPKSDKSKPEKFKFPPPVVRPDKPKTRKSKGQVKFPPPVVRPDKHMLPPPPPVEPKTNKAEQTETQIDAPAGNTQEKANVINVEIAPPKN